VGGELETKERLGFSLYSILIDVGRAARHAEEFSDRITTIRATRGGKDIFVKF
jgi:hypothetical protein